MGKGIVVLLIILLSGCGLPLTKWECGTSNCIPKYQATNKCLAQANSAFSKNKSTIWSQCMKGEGFEQIRCDESDRGSSDCQLFHVY